MNPTTYEFTKRLRELGVIPKDCAEWTIKGYSDGEFEIRAIVSKRTETFDKLAKALTEQSADTIATLKFESLFIGEWPDQIKFKIAGGY